MSPAVQPRIGRWIAMLWLAASSIYLLVLSVVIFGNARFPLNLGAIKTTGRTGLSLTLAPAIAGLLVLCLVLLRARAGAIVLGVYCGSWTAILACVLPSVWNAYASFCTATMCVRTP